MNNTIEHGKIPIGQLPEFQPQEPIEPIKPEDNRPVETDNQPEMPEVVEAPQTSPAEQVALETEENTEGGEQKITGNKTKETERLLDNPISDVRGAGDLVERLTKIQGE